MKDKGRAESQGVENSLTIMFTDLVGSSQLYHERGDSTARSLVSGHLTLLNQQLEKFNGTLIKTLGDSLMVTFTKAKKALACAMAMQRVMAENNRRVAPADQLHIRIGIHSGPVIEEAGDVHGDTVNITARIEEQAPGDEIYTSANSWQAATALDAEIEPLGKFELRGIPEPLHLVRLIWDAKEIVTKRQLQLDKLVIPALADALGQRKCILILGGLTLGLRKGTVRAQLAKEMGKTLGMEDRREDLSRLASFFEEENDRDELVHFVSDQVQKLPALRNGIIQALAAIDFPLILTTDLDTRIDEALEAAGRKVRKFTRIEEADPSRLQPDEVTLVKLYGDITDSDSLAITEEDLSDRQDGLKYAPEEFLALLATRPMLFVGFRWSDPRFKRLHRTLSAYTESDRAKATGVSIKVAAGVRGTWRQRGLTLVQADEIEFAQKLRQAIAGIKEKSHQDHKDSDEFLVDVSGLGTWKRPYKFLSSFQEEDEQIFFGREDEKRKVFSLAVSNRLVLLHGASGTGKTSLLNAGVVPQLKREGYAVMVRRPLKEPEDEIREGLAILLRDKSMDNAELGEVSSRWVADVLSDRLHAFLSRYVQALEQPLIIILDQFEEFFVRFAKKARQAFAEQLGAIVKDRELKVHFVLSLRDDFHSKLSELKPKIPDIFHHDFRLENLTLEGMARAIKAPAKLAGLRFQAGLIDRILADLGTVGSEPPQLQIICDRMYDELREGEKEFADKHFDALGGAKGILGSYLERFIANRTPAARELTQMALKALVTSKGTRSVISARQISQEINRPLKTARSVLDQLLQARLARKIMVDDSHCYELSHEYLIEEITKWIAEKDNELKRARELLRQETLNHERFGLLIAPSRVRIIQNHETELNLSKEETALLKNSLRSHRRKRQWSALLSLLVIGGVLIGALALARNYKLGLCKGAEEKLAGVWDQQVKSAIQSAFQKSGRPYAQDTFKRIEKLFDKQAAAWTAMHTEACEATNIHGTQSNKMLDLRMNCLDRKRTECGALTKLFARGADGDLVDKAVQAALKLGSLDRCADKTALLAAFPPPESPQVRARVAQLQKKLADVRALNKSGKYPGAFQAAKIVLAETKETGFEPLVAEALLEFSVLSWKNGLYHESEKEFRKTLVMAARCRHDEIVAKAATGLLYVVGYKLGRYEAGLQSYALVESALIRGGSDPALTGRALSVMGILHERLGAYDQALEYEQRALSIRTQALGADHPDVASSLNNLAIVSERIGNYQDSLRYHRQALAIREKTLGPAHISVAESLNNIGIVLQRQGNYDEAQKVLEQADVIWAETLGAEIPVRGHALNNLGIVFNAKGKYQLAMEHFQLALGIWEKSSGPNHSNLAHPLTGMGECSLALGELGAAHTFLERALTIRESKACDPNFLAETRIALAKVLWQEGQNKKRAIAQATQARETLRKAKGKFWQNKLADVESWLASHS